MPYFLLNTLLQRCTTAPIRTEEKEELIAFVIHQEELSRGKNLTATEKAAIREKIVAVWEQIKPGVNISTDSASSRDNHKPGTGLSQFCRNPANQPLFQNIGVATSPEKRAEGYLLLFCKVPLAILMEPDDWNLRPSALFCLERALESICGVKVPEIRITRSPAVQVKSELFTPKEQIWVHDELNRVSGLERQMEAIWTAILHAYFHGTKRLEPIVNQFREDLL